MVKFAISKQGDTLLSNSFNGYNSKLLIKCKKCGEDYEQTLNMYRKGYQHKKCSDRLFESSSGLKLATRPVTYLTKICINCEKEFVICKSLKRRITCSDECKEKYIKSDIHIAKLREAGLKSVKSSCSRSKNEIYFAELCKSKFENVLTNEKMFEGWDADVILPLFKIAINWNGIFHYKPIRKGMNIEKVKNRDSQKNEAIIRSGYTPYNIKDMGSYNKKFVESEFKKFLDYIYFT
ncbi:MAG: hypothetical protein JSR17_01450 [Proteobacteria bacterium]|nr:hypothetical protein [Pseudomonadota bacterium]